MDFDLFAAYVALGFLVFAIVCAVCSAFQQESERVAGDMEEELVPH